MIKFFRKIRQNSLMENKTGKYLKYAVGEILLVVIGILIALQINNWNEDRKQQDSLNAIYLITKEDINHDISEIDSFIKDYEEIRKPAFEAVLHTKLTKEDWLKNPHYKTVIGGFKDFTINQRGFELLQNQTNRTMSIEQNLDSKINVFYNKHNVEIEVGLLDLRSGFIANIKNLKQYDWFSSYLINNEMDEAIDYISSNPMAKNDISLYYIVYKIYIDELSKFKTNGIDLVIQIDNHFKKK